MQNEPLKLKGAVRRIEVEFIVFEVVDGKLTKTESRPGGYIVFDKAGRIIEDVSPYRLLVDGVYKDMYFYDEAGTLLYREEYDENESMIGKTIFERSENGGRIEKYHYLDKQGTLKLGSHIIYDERGEVVETAGYDENEEISPRHVHIADPRAFVKNETLNENGYTVEEFRYDDQRALTDKQVTNYDADGNVREFSCYRADGALTLRDRFEHEFDASGNWVKQTQYHWVIGWGNYKLVPLTEVSRHIDYYK